MRFADTLPHSAVPLVLLFLSLPSELSSRAPRPPRRNTTQLPCHDSFVGCQATPVVVSPPPPRCTSRCLGTVSILGLFELTEGGRSRPGGWSEVEAAKLAVHHVNSQRILGGVTLHLIVNDTKGDPGVGLDAFFHAIYTKKERLAILLGSANSEVTESLAKVVPYWNILQVSFGSMSPALSDRSEFPYFYRTIAPDSSHNPARIAFLKRFSWETVTAFSQNEDIYSLAVNDLVTELEMANITCKSTITFAETEIVEQLEALKVADSEVEKREAKTKTLMEILQFVHERDGMIPEPLFAAIVKMFSVNIFRSLPPNDNSDFDPEEDEQKFDPAWPHLHIVYEIFLRCVEFGHFKIEHGKKYLTEKFIFSFLDMFNAEDPRERDMLKTILHRIYAKIVMIRLYIRKQMNYIFYRYIYEHESFNGVAELLEISGSIINGFNLPLKEEHKDFFRRILLPLLKTNHLSVFHPQLIYCIVQFLEKDPKLTEQAISQMLRYWPKTCSHKEVIFLAGIEEIMDVIEPNQFVKIEVPLFQQIAKCIVSPHFQVAERALYFWNNEYLLSLLNKHISTIMPLVFSAVYQAKDHWNKAIVALAYNVLKSFMEMDSEMFDTLVQPYLKKKGDEPDSQSDSEQGNYSSDSDTT